MPKMTDKRKTSSGPTSSNVTKQADDPHIYEILRHIFADSSLSSEASAQPQKSLDLSCLQTNIDRLTNEVVEKTSICSLKDNCTLQSDGRIGPADVIFDAKSNIGTLGIDPDKLGVTSHGNFSTIRANCCVYRGKWVYEVMLWSKGVMQVGWSTIRCRFTCEEGVGDTADSYSYDGSRLRKWNVKTHKYGEAWLAGDVISCALDCDNRTMTFYRNGKSMGEAFSNIKTGSGYAYFPAVSLSRAENLRANFGATPLQYPIDGYQPLQAVPREDVVRSQVLLGWIEKLLPILIQEDQEREEAGICKDKMGVPPPPLGDSRSKKCSLLLVIAHIFEKLAPLLKSPYVVECCLVPLLLKFCNEVNDHMTEQPLIMKLLDVMWSFMQEHEIKPCMDNLITSLLYCFYKSSPVTSDFSCPKTYLIVTLRVLQHQQTRRYMLLHVLFDKIKFPVFMHIKPPDDAGLANLIPTVWWATLEKDDDSPLPPKTAEEQKLQEDYAKSCDSLQIVVEELEEIQVDILKVLLTHSDAVEGKKLEYLEKIQVFELVTTTNHVYFPGRSKDQTWITLGKTSRLIFLEKIRIYLKSNNRLGRLHKVTTCPLSFFHRLLRALRYYWDEFQAEDPTRFVSSTEAYMPIHEFWSDRREVLDVQRCGGLVSHLNRVLGSQVNQAQGLTVSKDGSVVKSDNSEYPPLEMPSGNSLMDLLDIIVLLYHWSCHAQLSKLYSLRDDLKEFVVSLQDTKKKLDLCPPDCLDIKEELSRAKTVLQDQYEDLARQMGWLIAVVYSTNKQEDIAWLLSVTLRTVEKASAYKLLFQYTPEFYMDTIINASNALRLYFHPIVSVDSLQGYDEIKRKFAFFLTRHFADGRIVNADLRDNIIQALACFICYPKSLKTLEELPQESKENMVRSLIAPYENRSWAQTNWILVRIWKGCGYGNRYTHLPHLVPSKHQLTEFGTACLQKPCPSTEYQKLFKQILMEDIETSNKFIDTLMNQLNWSFSEFIGMMQEIHQRVSRTEIRILEARQLKICATCFEIAVCLMRVLEMTVTVVPELFLDLTRESSDLLLGRLVQLLDQVLNRVTSKNGMFSTVVSMYIQGLESVSHYPILAVTIGIFVQLVLKSSGPGQDKVIESLLSDPGFQISSLEFTLGISNSPPEPVAQKPKGKKDKIFGFDKFEEISKEEVENVKELIELLKIKEEAFVQKQEVISEDDLCPICYANPISAVFKPCNHQSCRTCISHQLMNKKECFFCKVIINEVHNLKGQPILNSSKPATKKS